MAVQIRIRHLDRRAHRAGQDIPLEPDRAFERDRLRHVPNPEAARNLQRHFTAIDVRLRESLDR